MSDTRQSDVPSEPGDTSARPHDAWFHGPPSGPPPLADPPQQPNEYAWWHPRGAGGTGGTGSTLARTADPGPEPVRGAPSGHRRSAPGARHRYLPVEHSRDEHSTSDVDTEPAEPGVRLVLEDSRTAEPFVPSAPQARIAPARSRRTAAVLSTMAVGVFGVAAAVAMDDGRDRVRTIVEDSALDPVEVQPPSLAPTPGASPSVRPVPLPTGPSVGATTDLTSRLSAGVSPVDGGAATRTGTSTAVPPTTSQPTLSRPTASTSRTVQTSPTSTPTPQPTTPPPTTPELAARAPDTPKLSVEWTSPWAAGLRLREVRPGSGRVQSIQISGDGLTTSVRPSSGDAEYRVTIQGLTPGSKYKVTALVCNSSSLCTGSKEVTVRLPKAPKLG